MQDEPETFAVPASSRRAMLLCGLPLLLMAVFGLVVAPSWATLLVALFLGGLGAWAVRYFFKARDVVTATAGGLRVGDSAQIAWSDIAAVRAHPIRGVTLRSRDGAVLMPVDLQLDHIGRLLYLLVERVAPPGTAQTFGGRRRRLELASTLLIALAVAGTLLAIGATISGVVILPIMLWVAIDEGRTRVQRLEVLPDVLRVQTALTSRDIARERIRFVTLVVRYSKLLDVVVVLDDESALFVKPAGADAWHVVHAVRRWAPQSS